MVCLLHALLCRVHQVTDYDDAADEGGIADEVKPGSEQRDIDDKYGKCSHDRIHDDPGSPLPHAGVGFPVVFLHDRLELFF